MAAPFTELLKAAAEPLRLRILNLLRERSLCVNDLQVVLEVPQSTVSRHLAILRHTDLVVASRRGPRTYYSLIRTNSPHLECLRQLLTRACACEEVLRADLARLRRGRKGKKGS